MLRLLVSDIYRLVHGRMLWVMLVLVLATTALVPGVLSWTMSENYKQFALENAPADEVARIEAGESAAIVTSDSDLSSPAMYELYATGTAGDHTTIYASIMAQGAYTLLVSLAIVLFHVSDYSHGFIKSLAASREDTQKRFIERILLTAIMSVALLFVFIGGIELFFRLFRLGMAAEEIGSVVLWCALLAFLSFIYAAICLVVIEVTHSTTAGVLVTVFLSVGAIGQLVLAALSLVSTAIPAAAELAQWLPAACSALLQQGAFGLISAGSIAGLSAPVHIACTLALWAIATVIVGLVITRRRSVA